jgi:zinc transporter 7
LLHELPHEVGDVAILIAAGYRPTQAVKMQFCTALGAMAGTIVGLLSGTYFSEASEVIGLITAGGFMYVALVTVLPSLLDDSTFWQSVGEVLAIGAGVGLMACVSIFE